MSQKGLAPILLVIIITILGVGGYFTYTSLRGGTPKADDVVIYSSPSPSSVSDETANWKTYTNTKRGYEFSYPNEYSLQEDKQTATFPEIVSLKKDVRYTEGGGFAGGDALRDGVNINFTIFPSKDISEAELKSEFGSDISFKKINTGGKDATEILFPPNIYPGRKMFYKYPDGTILSISSYTGFEASPSKQQEYLSTFNQILSTFKFTQ